MYALLKSKRGATTVISTHSLQYPDMIRSGNYEELYTGTKKECEHQEEEYNEELHDALGGLAD
jgi:hypothetical protein